MNNNKTMEVVDWCDMPSPSAPKVPAQRRYVSPIFIGLLGTLLIHALIVPSAFGSRAHRTRPTEIPEAGTLLKSKADPAESLVLVTLPTLSSSSHSTTAVVSSELSFAKLAPPSLAELEPPALLDIEILTLGEEQLSQSTEDSGEATEQARLFGIYTGQIRARVERIWRRPRTPVNESAAREALSTADNSFQCQVQIVQDAHGFVQEVLLPQCNGSAAWQRSLVVAIQQASPLPAPPSARVFSRSIALEFIGLPYGSGSSEEDYDIQSRKVARVGNHD